MTNDRLMSLGATLRRAGRVLVFARYAGLAKIARRLEIAIRRRVRDRLGAFAASRVAAPVPARYHHLPQPVFAPRKHFAPIPLSAGGWRFTFLNQSVDMAGPGIDWLAPSSGAAHQLWRMNLHYMEYLESVSDGVWRDMVADWIAANPDGKRGAWTDSWNSYALSIRVVVWLQELARRAGRLTPDLVARVEASAVEQLVFLEHNLETDICGNHLIKNIKTLIWASAYFAGPVAERWRLLGLKHLQRELERQIPADGMHYERSPSYHAQVFADLVECRHTLGEDPLGGNLDAALKRMAQTVADLTHPDGGPALFNDAGLMMAYAPETCLSAYESLFGSRPKPRGVFAFPDAGYFGMRTQSSYLVADCGRIAPDDLPAHGHGDVLSFEWSVEGHRIIVDQGVYEYFTGPRRRQSQTAMSHNTLCLEHADQAEFYGSFRCARRPNVYVRSYHADACRFVLEGSHDGFTHLAGRPTHVRQFDVSEQMVRIADRLEGRASRTARIGFLLHPEVTIVGSGSEVGLARGDARVVVRSSDPLTIEDAVWWPDMGHELRTHRLVITMPPGANSVVSEWCIEPPTSSREAGVPA
jgi:uncharacterized heparinase superfamily protein